MNFVNPSELMLAVDGTAPGAVVVLNHARDLHGGAAARDLAAELGQLLLQPRGSLGGCIRIELLADEGLCLGGV